MFLLANNDNTIGRICEKRGTFKENTDNKDIVAKNQKKADQIFRPNNEEIEFNT